MIGRLFGRKPNDEPQSRASDRLITSRDAGPSQEALANEARLDAAVEAAVDTVALSSTGAPVPSTPTPDAAAPSSPTAPAAPAAPVHRTAPAAPAAPGHRTAPVAPSAPIAPIAPDLSIADAFDLLLAEEQGEVPTTIYGGHYSLTDADLDRVAARVIDRLSRGPMNETVTRIVTEVSERLVREEIARMRQAADAAAGPSGDQS